MATARPDTRFTARPFEERPLSGPILTTDVAAEILALKREPTWKETGHNARTLVKYPDLRIVLEVQQAGTRIRTHEPAERMTLQCIEGALRVHLPDGGAVETRRGHLLALDKAMAHEVEALEDCAYLLTVSWPGA